MFEVADRLSQDIQIEMLHALREVLAQSPLMRFAMPAQGIARKENCNGIRQTCWQQKSTTPLFNVRSTNFGEYGWLANGCGYHYADKHPLTQQPFPPIPDIIRETTIAICESNGLTIDPQSAYLNWYDMNGRLNLHRDIDEKVNAPVVSFSVGASADFLIGGKKYMDAKRTILLESGDIVIMSGENRYDHHGISKIHAGTVPTWLNMKNPGRINVTVRQYK